MDWHKLISSSTGHSFSTFKYNPSGFSLNNLFYGLNFLLVKEQTHKLIELNFE